MNNVINLTPHAINVIDRAGTVTVLEPSGNVARVAVQNVYAGTPVDGLDTYRQSYGAVEGLPEQQPYVLLVVSAMVRLALPDRLDLCSPGELVRDDAGQPIGCLGLVRNHRDCP